MTERLDGTVARAGEPGIAASSYAADAGLLAELRAAWPLVSPPVRTPAGTDLGFVGANLAAREPDAAIRLGDRYGVALIAEPDGSFLAAPVARDEVLVTSWCLARPGDGLSAFVAGVPMASERAIDVDQTNASTVVGERAIVKWFRRVGPGPSRATTLIAHLDAVGFAAMPAPLGSIAWGSPAGAELTLAQGDAFLPGARDGWDWAVARLERHVAHDAGACPAGCDPWIGARLGGLVAGLHAALRTPTAVIPDPASEASIAMAGTWRAAALRTLDDALAETPATDPDGDRELLAAIEPSMRAELDALPLDRPVPIQPAHGDLHVGQILDWAGGLAVIDFDGNPALGADGNALRQPVERDIAQMAMSLDHVGRIVDRRTAGAAQATIEAWIRANRTDFLAALDNSPDAALLAAFEVEQECRELVYAAGFLPRWRYAPLAALRARYGD